MKIIYKRGDLLECEEKYILHGCNLQGVMGSGVAKAIKAKYLQAFLKYYEAVYTGAMLGDINVVPQPDGKIIINGFTQEFYGRDGKRYINYDALKKVIVAVDEELARSTRNVICVAMPKIGAGLGGGDWNIISKVIEAYSKNFKPVVYEL